MGKNNHETINIPHIRLYAEIMDAIYRYIGVNFLFVFCVSCFLYRGDDPTCIIGLCFSIFAFVFHPSKMRSRDKRMMTGINLVMDLFLYAIVGWNMITWLYRKGFFAEDEGVFLFVLLLTLEVAGLGYSVIRYFRRPLVAWLKK